MASPYMGRDVVILRVILTATPEQPSRDVWIVIRDGRFLGTHDDLDSALRIGHQIADEANVQCWQSDGQVLRPARPAARPTRA